jgi:hypothetical protein
MIQQIRHSVGLNPTAGDLPEYRQNAYIPGANTEQRAPLYVVSPERVTMAAVEGGDPAFEGCVNDTQLSFFLGKLALSWALRGFVSGIAIGAIGTAVTLYYLPKPGR